MKGPSKGVVLATAAVAFVCVVAVIALNAPANWLAIRLLARTGGIVVLADARGTVWSGSAVLGVGSPAAVDGDGAARTALALPGRVTWTLDFERALAPVLHLTHDGVLLQPLAVRYRDGEVVVDAGAVALPASMLRLAGAPLNTLLPEGRCELRWNGLRFARSGPPLGDGTLRIANFALAISPVKPLGDYRVTWSSGADGLAWQLATERGPLDLRGGGSLAGGRNRARVTVRVMRDAPAPVVAQLKPLLDMLGRRSADEAVIETGGRR